MKSSTLRTANVRRRSAFLAAAGALALASQVGCSDEPGTTPSLTGGSTGNPGVAGTGNTPPVGTAGTGTGGTGTGGTGFTTAGTGTGGTTGGTGAGGTTAGTGGTGVIVPPPPPYCETTADSAVPFEVTTSFYPSSWDGLNSQIGILKSDEDVPANNCAPGKRASCAIGGCTRWTFTPAVAPSWAAVRWINEARDQANYVHPAICLPTGVKRISFFARGAVGGEVIAVGGAGKMMEAPITLTNEWKEYSVDLAGVDYNNGDAGVPTGFVWKVEPAAGDAPIAFDIDNIRFVTTDAPAANAPLCGGGGTGGTGGGAGGGGAGGAAGAGGGGAGGADGAGSGGGGAGGTN